MSTTIGLYDILMIVFFIAGYALIIAEHVTHINKATTALLMAIVCWIFQFQQPFPQEWNLHHFNQHLANVAQVVLFLLGALTIVEIIQVHGGFAAVSRLLNVRSKVASLWVIGCMAFFLSSVLDNLTTTIVMVVMVRKLVKDLEDRLIFGSMIVIAANAGGAWTPIGDVTTTMLWVGNQVSTWPLIRDLFLPSIVCCTFALLWFSLRFKGEKFEPVNNEAEQYEPHGKLVFILGILSLVFVPIFRMLTGLPPFMGILFSMSFMWFVTDILHRKQSDREHLKVISLLPRLDLSGVLFFLGILLAVAALETAGILVRVAQGLDFLFPSKTVVATMIGLASAVIDNVPLVAATMGMYDLSQFPTDHSFWQLIAFTAGTGGSILIIGSAAGVAFMGMERVSFSWYLKKVSLPAAGGYFAGIATYLIFCS